VFSDRLLSRSADDRLFHTVGPWKAKLGWPTVVCDLDRSMPTAVEDVLEVYRHAEFLQIWRCNAV